MVYLRKHNTIYYLQTVIMKVRHSLKVRRLLHTLNKELKEELDDLGIIPVRPPHLKIEQGPTIHRNPILFPKDI